MGEIIQNILNKFELDNKDKLESLLYSCIEVSKDTEKSTYAIHDNILFKIDRYFQALEKFTNSIKKDQRLSFGLELTGIVLAELGYELDQEDVFVFYHLRGLGKFRLKESKLKAELKPLWAQFKEYALEDQEFSRTLKKLMRSNLISYRRGNLWLSAGTVIRYRN